MKNRSVARSGVLVLFAAAMACEAIMASRARCAALPENGTLAAAASVELAVNDTDIRRATLQVKSVAVGAVASGYVVLSNATSATMSLAPPVVTCACLLAVAPAKLEIPPAGKASFRLSSRLSDRRRVSETALFNRADGVPLAIVEFLATSLESTSGSLAP